jgi:dienelactone hydrolase
VFFVHGGPIPVEMTPPTQWGFFVSYGELVAASAFVGVTLNHRLHAPSDYGRSQSDVEAAIEYVRSHTAELNVDPDRIALWYFSGGGALLSAVLRNRPEHVRCALAFYPFLDVSEKARDLPIFIARAGLDQPMINKTIDLFVQEALAGNADLELMNHPTGRHGFAILDDNDRSREIIARAVAFVRSRTTESG